MKENEMPKAMVQMREVMKSVQEEFDKFLIEVCENMRGSEDE